MNTGVIFGRPFVLSDRCPVCLSELSVTLVYCGQTVGWIKMPLGTEVGLCPGDIVLNGDPAPSSPHGKGHSSPPPLFDPLCSDTVAHLTKTAELLFI